MKFTITLYLDSNAAERYNELNVLTHHFDYISPLDENGCEIWDVQVDLSQAYNNYIAIVTGYVSEETKENLNIDLEGWDFIENYSLNTNVI